MSDTLVTLRLDDIHVGRNIRRSFDERRMTELTESIKRVGILQPLVVRVAATEEGTNHYVLVCGERRLRAARAAGLETVPVVIRELDEHQAREVMIIENLQRQDLDPIDEAEGYRTLLKEHGYKQEELAARLGVSQSHVSNRLRLLRLPDEVRSNISREILSPGHGLALLKLQNAPEFLTRVAHHLAETETSVAGSAEEIEGFVRETAKPLEKDTYLHGGPPVFELDGCKDCKCRFTATYWGGKKGRVCLDEKCWEKRQAAAQAEWETALKRELDGGEVLGREQARSLPWGSYERLDYVPSKVDLTECRECESKKLAALHGEKPVEICMKPKCLKAKQAAATRAKNTKLREAFKTHAERVVAWAAETVANGVGKETLVLLTGLILLHVEGGFVQGVPQQQVGTYLKKTRGWEIGEGRYYLEDAGWPKLRAVLEGLSEEQLLALALEWAGVAKGTTGMLKWAMGEERAGGPGDVDAAG